MEYTSTRDNGIIVASAQTIARGISEEGGLFVPVEIPHFAPGELRELAKLDYEGRANAVFGKYLTDYTPEEIKAAVHEAYCTGRFENDLPDPLVKLDDGPYMLELWHGPTCAFKDVALQILPQLMTRAVKKTDGADETVILVATSGDTGKAALEGFRDVPGTKIIVFYPSDGVSAMQKLQMATQRGKNVAVCAVRGNFDDTQSAVKKIFTDSAAKAELSAHGRAFSSANSINFGRLLPQIVYYVSSYCTMLADGELEPGERVNFTVPTGNFGNILAAYYAGRMGVPVNKLICASNSNNVLTDFLNTGVYDRNRKFYATSSPSMDILISSNLERLLYLLLGEDDAAVRSLMAQLADTGRYEVPDSVKAAIKEQFAAGWCDDRAGAETIKSTFEEYSYLLDTHTAVAMRVYRDYVKATGDKTKTVIASTASPYKFPRAVLSAIGERSPEDEFAAAERLSDITRLPVPEQIRALRGMEPRFTGTIDRTEMREYVMSTALSTKEEG